MDESSGSRTILRTLFIAMWFVIGAVFVGWQLSDGTLTDAVRKVAHIEDKKDGADAGDGISFGGETHQLSLGGEDSDEEDAEAAEADAESIDEGDDQASEDNDDSESVDTADSGESVEGDVQSDEPEDPQYEAAADVGSTDDDDEEDDHVGIGEQE